MVGRDTAGGSDAPAGLALGVMSAVRTAPGRLPRTRAALAVSRPTTARSSTASASVRGSMAISATAASVPEQGTWVALATDPSEREAVGQIGECRRAGPVSINGVGYWWG